MVRDITYCDNADCPFTDCWRHLDTLKGEKESVIISISHFGGVCRKYISYLVEQASRESGDFFDYYLSDTVDEQ